MRRESQPGPGRRDPMQHVRAQSALQGEDQTDGAIRGEMISENGVRDGI